MIRAMIVDDELPIREWLKMIISKADTSVEVVACVASGEEAYANYLTYHPTLIITDIKMGNMDGIELLKKIKEQDENVYIVMLTSYNDFDYARNSLRYGADEYILKIEITQESIKKIIENYRSQHEKGSVPDEKIFIDEILKDDTDSDLKLFNQKDEKYSEYYGISVRHNDSGETINKFAFSEKLNVTGIYFDRNNNQYFLLEGLSSASHLHQYNEVLAAAKNIAAIYNKAVGFSGISKGKTDALKRAQEALNISFYRNLTDVYTFTEKNNTNKIIVEINTLRTKSIKEIYNDNFNQALRHLRAICNLAREETFYDIMRLKSVVIDILNAYKLSQIDFKKNSFQNEVEKAEVKLRSCNNINQFMDIIDDFFRNSQNVELENMNYSAYTKQAIKYIYEHYSENISLVDVVEHININTEYFCRIFKNETNQTFINYLTDFRMKKAKELLTKSEYSINEIAAKLGYSSLAYFSRVFKKKTGQNPFDYRND